MSNYRKTKDTERNTNYTANMDILIKKLSPETIEKDKILSLNPPLRTVVSVDLIHNHTICLAAALKLLSVPEEVMYNF